MAETDARFRDALTLVLQAAGYDVVPSGDACDVLRAILVASVVAVVLNDDLEVDGQPLSVAARAVRPTLPIIAITDEPARATAAGIRVLRRPFRRDTLLRVLHEAGAG